MFCILLYLYVVNGKNKWMNEWVSDWVSERASDRTNEQTNERTSVGQAGWQTWRRRIRVVFACIWESRQRSSSFAGYQGVSTVFFRVTFILDRSKPCVAGKTLDSIRVNVVGHLMMPTKINCINPLILKISLVILLSGCYTFLLFIS